MNAKGKKQVQGMQHVVDMAHVRVKVGVHATQAGRIRMIALVILVHVSTYQALNQIRPEILKSYSAQRAFNIIKVVIL